MRELRSHGVTLVELLVVVAILGIAAVAAIPFLSGADPQRLDTAARELADAVRFARSEALRTGHPHGFRLDATQRRIRVFRADTGTSPPTPVYDVRHPVSRQLYDVRLDGNALLLADTLGSAASYQGTCSDQSMFVFDSQGIARCGDPLSVLVRQGFLTLAANGLTRVVTLQGLAGQVTVQ